MKFPARCAGKSGAATAVAAAFLQSHVPLVRGAVFPVRREGCLAFQLVGVCESRWIVGNREHPWDGPRLMARTELSKIMSEGKAAAVTGRTNIELALSELEGRSKEVAESFSHAMGSYNAALHAVSPFALRNF